MNVKNVIRLLAICILLLSAFSLSVTAQSKKDRNKAKDLQDQADKAFVQKNYREAVEKYGQAIVLVPTNPYGHYRKGFAHFNLKENDQALSEFALALNQGFRPLEIHRVRGFIYYEQKNYDAALREVRSGLAIAPNDLIFLKALGEINLSRNAFTTALDAFQKAALVAPNDGDIYYNIARVQFGLGDAKAQAEAAATALAKGTRLPGEAYYLLGDGHQKQRNAVAAIDAYQKAINSKPDLYQAYRNLSEVFRSANRFTDAINISKQALKTFPNDGGIYTG